MLFEVIPLKSGTSYALMENFFDLQLPLRWPPGTVRIRSCDQFGQTLESKQEEGNFDFSNSNDPEFDLIALPTGSIVDGRVGNIMNEELESFAHEIREMVVGVVTPEVCDEAHKEAVIREALQVEMLLDMVENRRMAVELEIDAHDLEDALSDRLEEAKEDAIQRIRSTIARKVEESGEEFPEKE